MRWKRILLLIGLELETVIVLVRDRVWTRCADEWVGWLGEEGWS